MRAWISSFRPPDDAVAHHEAMAKLEDSRAGLQKIDGNLNRALASAAPILTRSTHRQQQGAYAVGAIQDHTRV
jgi:hypothetical protein